MIDTSADIETPEHVEFRYKLAGPSRRAGAYTIDLLIRGVVIYFAYRWLSNDVEGNARSFGVGLLYLLYFVLEWGYYIFFELIWSGQSPGKRALGLRVVGNEGHPLTFLQSVLRNLVRFADYAPSLNAVGVVVMSRDRSFRRLGDLVAGTMVVVEERRRTLEQLRISPPPTAAELESLPANLRLSRLEQEHVELLLRREGSLNPKREAELAEMIAPLFAARWGLRYRDPRRFLALLYAKAQGAEAPTEPGQRPRRRRRLPRRDAEERRVDG